MLVVGLKYYRNMPRSYHSFAVFCLNFVQGELNPANGNSWMDCLLFVQFPILCCRAKPQMESDLRWFVICQGFVSTLNFVKNRNTQKFPWNTEQFFVGYEFH